MADTAALVVALSAQLTKFEKDMKDAGRIADQGVKRIEQSFAGIKLSGLDHALKGLAIAEVATKFKELIESIDNLGDQAEIVGVTTDKFQELQFAIIASGQSAEAANTFMERFSRALSDAQRGTGDLADILRVNNVQVKGLTVESGLDVFADLIKNAKNSQDALNLAMTIGGRSAGPALVQALKGGSQGLKEMGEEAHKTGAVLSSAEIKEGQEVFAKYAILVKQLTVLFQKLALVVSEQVKTAFENLPRFPSPGENQPIEDFLFGKAGPKNPLRKQTDIFGEQAQGKGGISIKPGGSTPVDIASPGTTNLPDKQVEGFQKLIDAQEKRIQLLKAEADTIGATAGEQERLTTQINLENAAKEQNIALTPARQAAIQQEADKVAAATKKLAEQQFAFRELQSASTELGSALSQAFQGAIIEGQKFDVVLNNLVKRLESKAFDKLFDLAFAPQGAATSSVFTQLIQSLTGKMAGGPVSGGQPYLVGEKGPEIFVPGKSGMIIPNKVTAQGGKSSTNNLNVSVDVTGANGDRAIEDAVNKGVQRAVQQSVSIVNSTAPGRQLRYSQLGT